MRLLLSLWRLFEICFWTVAYVFKCIVTVAFTRASWAEAGGDCAAGWCDTLGPFFVKMGQILGTRRDLLPARFADGLSKLQDRTAPLKRKALDNVLTGAFGPSFDHQFSWFDYQPLASASVAQVHRAFLFDGAPVAVKVRRPGIVRMVQRDRELAGRIGSVLERIPGFESVPFRDILDEFSSVIESQLDLRVEARNCRRLAGDIRELPYVFVPKVMDGLSSETVLTMEFANDLTNTGATKLWSYEERHRVAVRSVHTLYTMTFVHGFLHGDMHPGNIFFRRDGTVVLLDFGIMADLKGQDLKHFADFFFGIVTNNGRDCARVVLESALRLPGTEKCEEFTDAMAAMVSRYAHKKAREFEVTKFAVELFDLQRKHGVRGSTRFMTTILAFVVFEGIAKQIDPELDFQTEARQFIPYVLRRLAPVREEEPAIVYSTQVSQPAASRVARPAV